MAFESWCPGWLGFHVASSLVQVFLHLGAIHVMNFLLAALAVCATSNHGEVDETSDAIVLNTSIMFDNIDVLSARSRSK